MKKVKNFYEDLNLYISWKRIIIVLIVFNLLAPLMIGNYTLIKFLLVQLIVILGTLSVYFQIKARIK
jgi:hypothetical protein